MAFSVEEIEDGTGRKDAIVYGITDPVAEAEAYLVRRGKTVFSSLSSEPLKDSALLNAVLFLTDETAHRLKGRRSNRDQGLPQPRNGQHVDRRRIPSNELPRIWLETFFLLTELSAAGEPLGETIDSDVGKTREALGVDAIEDEWGPRGKTSRKRYHVLDHLGSLMTAPGQATRG